MSLTEDPWRLRAGRDHILCGAFKKRPLGGTGHIRVLAHFPKDQKIIRCTEPNSTNPIHNYTHKSNKLCHITGKLNYYIKLSITYQKKTKQNKKTLRGTTAKMFLLGVGDMWPWTFITFSLQVIAFCCARGLILVPTRFLYSGRDLRFGFIAQNPKHLQWPWPILVYLSLRHILI